MSTDRDNINLSDVKNTPLHLVKTISNSLEKNRFVLKKFFHWLCVHYKSYNSVKFCENYIIQWKS